MPRESEGEIVGELGTCPRLLESTEETALAAYESWARARRSIFGAWTFETALADLQPKIRKLNLDVAAFLSANPAADVAQDRLHRCLDAVEPPWPRREENLLRLAWEREFETSAERARHLVEEVERIGADPYHAPEPLPPIETEEIHLITWMAIEREYAAAEVALEPGFPRIGLINGRQLVGPLVEHWNDIQQEFQERLGLKLGLVRI